MTDIQAWLDQGRTFADQATEGPWFTSPFEHDPVWGSVVTGGVDEHDEDLSPCIEAGNRKDAEFIADARTRLPRALDALQAVLDLHQPYTLEEPAWTYCLGCLSPDDLSLDGDAYPCPTVRAIQDAIGDPQ